MEELIGEVGPDSWTTAQRNKWRDLARTWHEAPAPASPSPQDLETFVGLIEGSCRPDGAVAIMGCTPSLRRALRSCPALGHVRVYCVDFSEEMWVATGAQLNGGYSEEQFVQATWHELATALPEKVDVVVGDKSLDNVEFANWPALLDAIHGALRPAGHLVAHVGLVRRDPVQLDVARVLRIWVDRMGSGLPDDHAVAGLWEDLLTGSVCGEPADPHRLSIGPFAAELRSLRSQSDLSSNEVRLLDRFHDLFGGSLDDSWTAFTFDELLAVTGDRFAPRAARWSSDYSVAPMQPILDFEALLL